MKREATLLHKVNGWHYSINIIINVHAGPLPHTVSDFWRMMWELKLPTIIMLTKVTENGMVCTYTMHINLFNSNYSKNVSSIGQVNQAR